MKNGKTSNQLRAHNALLKAVKEGRINRPEICEHCGQKSDEKIHGHHWSYAIENWLQVYWLCWQCHQKVHKGKVMLKPYKFKMHNGKYLMTYTAEKKLKKHRDALENSTIVQRDEKQ